MAGRIDRGFSNRSPWQSFVGRARSGGACTSLALAGVFAACAPAGSSGDDSAAPSGGHAALGGSPAGAGGVIAGIGGWLPDAAGGSPWIAGGSPSSGGSPPVGGATAGSGGAPAGGSSAGGAAAGGGGSAIEPLCARTVAAENRTVAGAALDALFVDKNVAAIDQYWADPYLQHNPIASSGVAAFKSIMGSFVTSPSFSYKRIRTLGDCELAVVQGEYSQTGVIFDMFRVEGGKLVEHWDSDSGQASATTGPTEITDEELSDENRALVSGLIDKGLVAGDAAAQSALSPSFVTHRSAAVQGGTAWLDSLSSADQVYTKLHHIIADGNFVFTLSEGTLQGKGYGFYDLFRIEGGLVVEHWDSRRSVPNSTQSGLPIF